MEEEGIMKPGLFLKTLLIAALTAFVMTPAFAIHPACELGSVGDINGDGVEDLNDQIECSIQQGLAYLAAQQDPVSGAIPDLYEPLASTGLACVKFLDRAKELGLDPFDAAEYQYADELVAAIDYMAGRVIAGDPGEFRTNAGHRTYTTGIAAMCFASSNAPERTAVTGAGVQTYDAILNGLVAWLNNNQQKGDSCAEGGWYYQEKEIYPVWGDNSISGYATMGLGFAAAAPPDGFGIPVPEGTLTPLDFFVDALQVTGGVLDGGSRYGGVCLASYDWINTLKTGNLLYELGLLGEGQGDERVDRGVDFIVRYWGAMAGQYNGGGWLGNYQSMFTMMKGLEGLGIDLLPAGDPEDPADDIEWYPEVAGYIVDHQLPSGTWQQDVGRGTPNLNAGWALLTLEKAVPEIVIEIAVPFDIKPGSCPNPLNVTNEGVTPMAIAGTEQVPVSTIDPDSVRLTRLDESGDPITDEWDEPILIEPLRYGYEDVATPFEGELCGCHELEGDGLVDMTLKFSTQSLVEQLGLTEEEDMSMVRLAIVGNIMSEEPDEQGTPIEGEDCIRVQK